MGWLSNWFNEQIFIAFGTFYYEALLYKGKVQVGRIVQSLSYSQIFIVDFDRKLAFFIEAKRAFVKGHKLILHYNIDNAIPLLPRTEIHLEEVNNNLTKTNTKEILSADITKGQKEKSANIEITDYNLPPILVFEKFNAHFVVKTVSQPKGTNWELVLLALIAAVTVLTFSAIFVFGFK
jgi:hypothetical protein